MSEAWLQCNWMFTCNNIHGIQVMMEVDQEGAGALNLHTNFEVFDDCCTSHDMGLKRMNI
jgi:hypothetical protein